MFITHFTYYNNNSKKFTDLTNKLLSFLEYVFGRKQEDNYNIFEYRREVLI